MGDGNAAEEVTTEVSDVGDSVILGRQARIRLDFAHVSKDMTSIGVETFTYVIRDGSW